MCQPAVAAPASTVCLSGLWPTGLLGALWRAESGGGVAATAATGPSTKVPWVQWESIDLGQQNVRLEMLRAQGSSADMSNSKTVWRGMSKKVSKEDMV